MEPIKKENLRRDPPRILLYGVDGIGKSTFASQLPSPIFVPTEKGLSEIAADRFPFCRSFDEVDRCFDFLLEKKHSYKSVIVDSVDWLEKLIWKVIASDHRKEYIEEIGYQAGYKLALHQWRYFLDRLDDIQERRGMIILLLAHSTIESYTEPGEPEYDKYQLDVHKLAAPIIYQWADAVLFLNYKNYITKSKSKDDGEVITRVSSANERIFYTEERPAFRAKNRYNFPPEISWMEKENGWKMFFELLKSSRPKKIKTEESEAMENSIQKEIPDVEPEE